MATVSASQIKTTIDTALSGNGITDVQVFDFPREDNRKKFPSVEIVVTEPEGNEIDPRVTDITQQFEIQLRLRKKGGGSDEVQRQKQIEDVILDAIDLAAVGQTTLFALNKKWRRPSSLVPKPVPHLLSTLVILVTETVSTTGTGQIGAKMTITIGSLIDIPLLDKPLERDNTGHEDILDVRLKRTKVAPTGESRTMLAQFEATAPLRSGLRTIKNTRSAVSCTLKRPTEANETFNAFLVDIGNGAPYAEVETIVVQLEVLSP